MEYLPTSTLVYIVFDNTTYESTYCASAGADQMSVGLLPSNKPTQQTIKYLSKLYKLQYVGIRKTSISQYLIRLDLPDLTEKSQYSYLL